MRTIDFETILVQSIQAIGLDRNNVSEETYQQLRDFANYRLKFAFEYDVWPELVRTTKFPVTNSGSMHYITIPDDGIVTNTEGTFKTDIGTILQVTVEDPRTKGKVKEVGFSFDEYEIELSSGVFKTVKRIIVNIEGQSELYITYRINCPELVGEAWSSTTTYYPGQTVYYAYNTAGKYFSPTTGASASGKRGNFWKCITQTNSVPNSNGNNVPVANDNWGKISIPLFFGNYIIKGIHADWLKSEQQVEPGFATDKEAQALLDFEVHKIIVQQGQVPRIKFNQIY